MQAYSLKFTHDISDDEAKKILVEIECLARQVYKSSIVLSSDTLHKWYQRNRFMWWLARENDRLIAYISAIPLTQQAFKNTLQPDFDEFTHLNENDIRNWNDGTNSNYSLYICSIVVHPDYQKRSDSQVFRLVFKYFLETLILYGKSGSIVTEWSGVAVSEVGRHILRNYFDLECSICDSHNNQIFYGKTHKEHQQELLRRVTQKINL